MTSPQENIPSTPESPVDFAADRRAEVLDNMGVSPAVARGWLGQEVATAPLPEPAVETMVRLRPSGRRYGHALPSDAEMLSDFAPPAHIVLARPNSSGPSSETLQMRDKALAIADWQRALRIANGDVKMAQAISQNSATHTPKGNPKV